MTYTSKGALINSKKIHNYAFGLTPESLQTKTMYCSSITIPGGFEIIPIT